MVSQSKEVLLAGPVTQAFVQSPIASHRSIRLHHGESADFSRWTEPCLGRSWTGIGYKTRGKKIEPRIHLLVEGFHRLIR